MHKTVWFFEVSVSVDGVSPNRLNPFHKGDKCRWVRKGDPHDTFPECQAAAIANGERPYRIKSEAVAIHEAQTQEAA